MKPKETKTEIVDTTLLPNNEQVETTLLSSCFIDPQNAKKAVEVLSPEDFYNEDNKKFFKVVEEIVKDGALLSPTLVFTKVEDKGEAITYITKYGNSADQTDLQPKNVESYIGHIKELSIRRKKILSSYEAVRLYSDKTLPLEDADKQAKEDSEQLSTEIDSLNDRRFKELLYPTSEDALLSRMSQKKAELPTLYELREERFNGAVETFSIPSSAITFIVALPSHGKSTLLQNIALQVAQTETDGATLYFTYEEEKDSVTMQFLNKYINTELCRNYDSSRSNNLRAITHYYRTGEDRYIATDKVQTFKQKKSLFYNDLYNSGKLRVYDNSYFVDELLAAIRYLYSQIKIKAVFIDYVGMLHIKGYKKSRTEELGDICDSLLNLAKDLDIPIVLAAQSNREAVNPLEMTPQRLADSVNLERYANKILFIWNSNFSGTTGKDSKSEIEMFENKHSIKLGEGGKIYAKLVKNRGGVANIEAVLDFNGNTGVIAPNRKVEPQQTSFTDDILTPRREKLTF